MARKKAQAEIVLTPDFDVDEDVIIDGPMVAYIAGPMGTFEKSIRRAVDAARAQGMLVNAGFVTYNPYGSCHSLYCWNKVTKDQWLENDFAFIGLADVMVLLPGWESSDGVKTELAFALSLDMAPDIMEIANFDDPEATEAKLVPVSQDRLIMFAEGGDA